MNIYVCVCVAWWLSFISFGLIPCDVIICFMFSGMIFGENVFKIKLHIFLYKKIIMLLDKQNSDINVIYVTEHTPCVYIYITVWKM